MIRTHLAGALCALALAACSSPEPLRPPPAPQLALPPANPPAGMTLSAIKAGRMHARAAMAYEGGAFGDKRIFNIGGILVEHPKGTLLFDAGFGEDLAEHVKTTPLLLRLMSRSEPETTVARQLAASGRDPTKLTAVILTHAHWDHVSGLPHLPGVPVWTPQAEIDFVNSGDRAGALARQLGTSAYRPIDFPSGPYLGFPASFDVFGDGSVVLVPAPGHTPGSIIAFIALPSGQRYALIGDLAWQSEGVDLPAERPRAARSADHDAGQTRAMLIRMHQIKQALPQIIVVPAHDRRVWDRLPPLAPKAG